MLLDIFVPYFDKIFNIVTFFISIYFPIVFDRQRRFDYAVLMAMREADIGLQYQIMLNPQEPIEYSFPEPTLLFSRETLNLFHDIEQTKTVWLLSIHEIERKIDIVHKECTKLVADNKFDPIVVDRVRSHITNTRTEIKNTIIGSCIKSKIWKVSFTL